MKKEDVLNLAKLARIEIKDSEAESLKDDISKVLDYVSVVSEITGEAGATKVTGAVSNVFREDEVTVEPESHTEDLLNSAPERKGRYVVVKKILNVE